MEIAPTAEALVDSFGRRISYVRLSVTDRCDLRCRYCMAEHMAFAPRGELLTLDEIETLAGLLIARGVRRIRLTGGEPLVRRGVERLIAGLGARIGDGLDELTLTSNGTQLARFAPVLRDAGVRRVNVSLDSRDSERFAHITRGGALAQVLAGIAAARDAGLAVKINMVALKGINEDEIAAMLAWCGAEGHDLTLIETMPLGDVEGDRSAHFLPLDLVKARLEEQFALIPSLHRSGGPARYFEVAGLKVRLGLIAPLSANFCDGCNRIRVTATGRIYGCLGHDQHVDVRALLREEGEAGVARALDLLLAGKPKGHDFRIAPGAAPAVARYMSATGG